MNYTKSMTRVLGAVALCLSLAAPAAMADEGTIKGKVTLKGGRDAVPAQYQMRPITTKTADPNCTKRIATEQAVVEKAGDGSGLRYVIVSIKDGLGDQKFDVPSEPVVIEQEGCRYTPHAATLTKGQKLIFKNADDTNHNVHGLPKKNTEFNFSQAQKGMTNEVDIEQVETFGVKCDVHPWMSCHIGVFAHPFHAVTEKDGSFELKNVPPGEYTLEFWHETFGTQTQKVTVESGSSAQVDVEFKAE